MAKKRIIFEMPQGLSEEARAFIGDVVKELKSRELLQNIDLGAIRMLATSYELYKQATDILLTEGPVVTENHKSAPHPAQSVATKNYNQVVKIMTEYGLTVKSRSKLAGMKPEKKVDSPLRQFVTGKIEKR